MRASDIPEATRAAMDGQPASRETFEAWMATKSDGAQDAMFGPDAARWRAGTLTRNELLKQKRHAIKPSTFTAADLDSGAE